MSSLTPEQLSDLLDDTFDGYCEHILDNVDQNTVVGVKITTEVTHSDGSITEFVDIHTPTEESSSVNKKPAQQENRPYRSNCFPDDK
jgi:hypothetical protein